jgi:hypothetical protein
MQRQSRKLERTLDGTVGHARSMDKVKGARWDWRDNENCYEFCVKDQDGVQSQWTIMSTPRKNLYDIECPNGEIQSRLKSQDVKKVLNSQIKGRFKSSSDAWGQLRSLLGPRRASQEIISHLSPSLSSDILQSTTRRRVQSSDLGTWKDRNRLFNRLDSSIRDWSRFADRLAEKIDRQTLQRTASQSLRSWSSQETF